MSRTLRSGLSLLILLWLVYAGAAAPVLEELNNDEIRRLPARSSVVVINFWATWCEPCVKEIPIFQRMHKRFKDVTIIGISMDDPDKESAVVDFVKKHKINYSVALWTGDDFETMVNSIDPKWDGPLPATFLFRNGKLIYSKVGQITEAELTRRLQH